MAEDFSVTSTTLDLCRAAHLLKQIYDITAEFDDMTVVDGETWDAVHNVLERLRPLQSYGSAIHQAEEVLKRVMMASVR